MSIPIVGANRTIVGWTDKIPEVFGAVLRHHEAEQLVGGRIMAVYVEVHDPQDAMRSGAPADWKGAWRCLALCSEAAVGKDGLTPTMPNIQVEPPPKR